MTKLRWIAGIIFINALCGLFIVAGNKIGEFLRRKFDHEK